ncbi:MAG TPA: phenylacetate--CoA ligase, partial [Paludibacteraceae bacterium]|jgi:phenylacetate-CoA ligase|nr:phenylacetate--CoA ligase [Paludibacteraceae bacterium]
MEEVEPHFFITVDRVNNIDTFEIQVEVKEGYYSDEMGKMIALKKKVAHEIQCVVGLQPDIKLVEPRFLQRSEGKAKRVLDKRVFKND